MAEAMENLSAVSVASIRGHCVGGGVVLAATCDLRIAASDARFSIPEIDLGIPLAWGGIPRLVREVGPALTKELVMTCRPFGADEARAARVRLPELAVCGYPPRDLLSKPAFLQQNQVALERLAKRGGRAVAVVGYASWFAKGW